jgi:zinc/manganese transport system substrate-binding protein
MKCVKHICMLGLWLAVCVLGQARDASARLNVVATTEDVAAIVREVGGDNVSVESLTRGYQSAHLLEAKPSFMVKLNRADLLAYQGLELEIGWLPLLIQGARNPGIIPGRPGHLDLSAAIKPLEIPTAEVDRSQGDVHPLGNPHYHLDPANGLLMASLVAERLSSLDPGGATAFKNNLQRFTAALEARIKEWSDRMRKFRGMQVVTYHATWSYFLRRFDLRLGGAIEPKPGIPPTPKHLIDLAELIRRDRIKLIVMENYYEPKHANLLAGKTGARVLILPASVGGSPEAGDYIRLFEYCVARIEQALADNGQ